MAENFYCNQCPYITDEDKCSLYGWDIDEPKECPPRGCKLHGEGYPDFFFDAEIPLKRFGAKSGLVVQTFFINYGIRITFISYIFPDWIKTKFIGNIFEGWYL